MALTFYFKDIFSNVDEWLDYIKEYEIADLNDEETKIFAKYIYKILYRQYCMSNVQYDTKSSFKNALANIIEDNFERYKKQRDLLKKMYSLTDDEILQLNTALANSANNPNEKVDDPLKPFEYVGAQVYSISKNGKLAGYLQAIKNLPNNLSLDFVKKCGVLFKAIIPEEIFIFEGGELNDF